MTEREAARAPATGLVFGWAPFLPLATGAFWA